MTATRIPPSFGPTDFDHEISKTIVSDLSNQNLFPPSKVRAAEYEKIKPALLLASRILLALPQTFALFVERTTNGGPLVQDSDVVPHSDEEIRRIISSMIPNIDLDLDMTKAHAITFFQPERDFDLVVLDAKLFRAASDSYTKQSHKIAALFHIAVLICHEFAHILEFRSIRKRQLLPSGEPFGSPPGATCAEVGLAWESKTFGGKIVPICYIQDDLSTILGAAVNSLAWNYKCMAIDNKWISELFCERFWSGLPDGLRVPYRTVLSETCHYGDADPNEEDKSDYSLASMPLRRGRGARGEILVGSPQRKFAWSPLQREIRTCGGKRVKYNSTHSREESEK